VLRNAAKTLKSGGRLANLDWKKIDQPFGPPLAMRFDEAEARQIIESAGFAVETSKEAGPYHYLILARVAS
jgi:hypothetical protein